MPKTRTLSFSLIRLNVSRQENGRYSNSVTVRDWDDLLDIEMEFDSPTPMVAISTMSIRFQGEQIPENPAEGSLLVERI